MAVKYITHYFKTSEEAAAFQENLYDKYNHVKLIDSPKYSEYGEYRWEVSE